MYKYLNDVEIQTLNKRIIYLCKFKAFISGNNLYEKYLEGRLNYTEIVELITIFKKLNYTPDEFNFNKILGYFKKLKFKNLKEAKDAMELIFYGYLNDYYLDISDKNKNKIRRNFIKYRIQADNQYSKFVKYKMTLDEVIEYMKTMKNFSGTENEVLNSPNILIEYCYKFNIISLNVKNKLIKYYIKLSDGDCEDDIYDDGIYDEVYFYNEILKDVVGSNYEIYSLSFEDLAPGVELEESLEKAFKGTRERVFEDLGYKPGDSFVSDHEIEDFQICDYYGDNAYLFCIYNLKVNDDDLDFINYYLREAISGIATEVYSENGNFYLTLSAKRILDGISIQNMFILLTTLNRLAS